MPLERKSGVNLDLIITRQKDAERFRRKLPMHLGPVQCWEWPEHRNAEGYGKFGLGKKCESAHRVSFRLFNGSIPPDMVVMHKCDNPPCCNPAHLKLGTWRDNAVDKWEKGRGNWARGDKNGSRLHPERLKRGDENVSRKNPELLPRGENHWTAKKPHCVARGQDTGKAKLTDEDIVEMRRLFRAGMNTPSLAKKFGLNQNSTYSALRGKSWAHVPDPIPMGFRHDHYQVRGARVNTAVLTEDQVRAIRAEYRISPTHRRRGNGPELSAKFGVSCSVISQIVRRKIWKHVA